MLRRSCGSARWASSANASTTSWISSRRLSVGRSAASAGWVTRCKQPLEAQGEQLAGQRGDPRRGGIDPVQLELADRGAVDLEVEHLGRLLCLGPRRQDGLARVADDLAQLGRVRAPQPYGDPVGAHGRCRADALRQLLHIGGHGDRLDEALVESGVDLRHAARPSLRDHPPVRENPQPTLGTSPMTSPPRP